MEKTREDFVVYSSIVYSVDDINNNSKSVRIPSMARPTPCQHLLSTDHIIITTTLFLHFLNQLQALVGAGDNTIDASSSTALSFRDSLNSWETFLACRPNGLQYSCRVQEVLDPSRPSCWTSLLPDKSKGKSSGFSRHCQFLDFTC